MINIYFFYTGNTIKGFKITGHSNLFKKLGYRIRKRVFKKISFNNKDYICSAVSAVAYMAVIGLAEECRKKVSYKENDSGFLECRLKEKPDKKSSIIFNSLLRTLDKIKDEYPDNLIIHTEE
ncbi:MAG: ribosomal-processing cysteine protease Prp [Spirochaetes bacterium]|nr:ribosomal-processing cysteine protease Prp [Spirochaetota bacterium]